MTSDRRRWLGAGLVSAGLLALVLWVADLGRLDLSGLRPLFLLPCVVGYAGVQVLRGLAYRALAGADAGADAGSVPLPRWIALAARHQLVFTLAPSGTGDLAFPVLARRMTGLAPGAALRLIAEARLRDVAALLGLGAAGLAASGAAPAWTGLAALPCAGVLLAAGDAVRLVRRLFGQARPGTDATIARPPAARRVAVAGLVIAGWLVASLAVTAGFAAAGHALSLPEAWVMLAGLNIAGALALSIAGLGVAEAGAAGVLALLGLPLAEAAAVAVLARPVLLLSTLAAAGLLDRGLARAA